MLELRAVTQTGSAEHELVSTTYWMDTAERDKPDLEENGLTDMQG
jgi:hypothetical protein